MAWMAFFFFLSYQKKNDMNGPLIDVLDNKKIIIIKMCTNTLNKDAVIFNIGTLCNSFICEHAVFKWKQLILVLFGRQKKRVTKSSFRVYIL